MKTPIEEPLATGEPFAGTVALSENAVTQRDALCKDADTLTAVASDEQLETATEYLKDINAFLKKNEEGRTKENRPHLDYQKLVNDFAAKFAAPLAKQKERITLLVNGWQRKVFMERDARDREARAEQEKAQRAATEAQEEISRQLRIAAEATNSKTKAVAEAALLAAQLKQETAALSAQSASATLAAPTNTPRGLVTKVRFDFEVLDWKKFVDAWPGYWRWDKAAELLKLDRAGLLKELNTDGGGSFHDKLPGETEQSINLPNIGLRVYRDIRSSTRS